MPATISLRGNVSSVARSTSTAGGSWNAPTRFLPASVLIPVLPPTAASTMASSVVGTCTTSTPRIQVAAAKPGEVGGRSAAEADDGVAAAEADAAQHLPAEADDRQLLAVLGVGDLDAMRVDALVRQVLPNGLGGLGPAPADAGSPPCGGRRAVRVEVAEQTPCR